MSGWILFDEFLECIFADENDEQNNRQTHKSGAR